MPTWCQTIQSLLYLSPSVVVPRSYCCFVAQYGTTRKSSLLSTLACLTDWAAPEQALIGALTQLDVLVEPMFPCHPTFHYTSLFYCSYLNKSSIIPQV